VTVELGVLVHHPGHHLGVGVDIGSQDVPGRPDHVGDLVDERPGDPLEFDLAEPASRAVDAPLGSSERDPDDRRLPAHQGGQGADLVEVDVLVVAHPPLVGAAGPVVLDPVAREDVELAARQADRDLDLDLATGRAEEGANPRLEAEVVGGNLEVPHRALEHRHLRRPGPRCLVGDAGRPVAQPAVAVDRWDRTPGSRVVG